MRIANLFEFQNPNEVGEEEPDYRVFEKTRKYTVVSVLNFAGLKELCSKYRSRACPRIDLQDFGEWSTGAWKLYAIFFPSRGLYFVSTDKRRIKIISDTGYMFNSATGENMHRVLNALELEKLDLMGLSDLLEVFIGRNNAAEVVNQYVEISK